MQSSKPQSWIIPAVAVVSLLGLFVWQLGVFNMGSSSITATGWAKIKPQLAATGLDSKGDFTGVFTNGVGTTITVNEVRVQNSKGITCRGVSNLKQVAAGQNFQIRAYGCGGGYPGDVYTVTAYIDYDFSIGGHKTSHTESGAVRGPLENAVGDHRSPSSAAYRGSSYYGYRSPSLHKSFDFGWWWTVVVILSIFLLMEANNGVRKLSSSTNVQLLAIYGFMFLLVSTLILLFGVDHLANSQVDVDYPLRLKYGWVIESAVYFLVGVGLLVGAEVAFRKITQNSSILPCVFRPLVTLVVLCILFVYPYRVFTTVYNMSYDPKISEFSWIFEVVAFLFMAIVYALATTNIWDRDSDIEPAEVFYYTKGISYIYFFMTVASFMWGVNSLINYTQGWDFRGLIGSFFMLIGGVLLLKVSSERKEKPLQQTSEKKTSEIHPILKVLMALGALYALYWVLVIAMYMVSPSYYRYGDSYIYYILVGLVVGYLASRRWRG